MNGKELEQEEIMAELKARAMLERMGVENVQNFSAGELAVLADLIAKSEAPEIIENKLERKFDPAGWQWLDKHGQAFQIEDLTRDDLLQVVCDCMIALSDIEWKKQPPAERGVYVWRGGPGIVALVLVNKRPTKYCNGGILSGKTIGGNSTFFDGCDIKKWVGDWLGPLPGMGF